jgi:hypothetical protein
MRFRGGEFSTGTKGNFQSELTHQYMGWMSERISSRLPVAGEVFFLDIPFYRTMLHALWLPEITIRQGHLRTIPITGNPDPRLISTSHIETTESHDADATPAIPRLTNAFSNKPVNLKATLCPLQLLPSTESEGNADGGGE